MPIAPDIQLRRHAVAAGSGIARAVLFDLDGTLYAQRPLRAHMAMELAAYAVRHPHGGRRLLRLLREYRRAHEELRGTSQPYDATQQLRVAASRSAVTLRDGARMVDEWMFARPLAHLPRYRVRGLEPLLESLTARGVRLGVLSDYEPRRKLRALGVERYFSAVLCAADPDVRALKPSPIGFLLAAARWNVDPQDVLMVGDRVDADAAGAAAAGMRSIIVGRRPAGMQDLRTTFVSSFEQVGSVIDECC